MRTTSAFNLDLLRPAVLSSKTYAEVLRKLGVVAAGGNYQTLKRKIREAKLDTGHFVGFGWSRGTNHFRSTHSLEDFLENKHPIRSSNLKNKLLRAGLLERRCHECLRRTWCKRPIPLELHHKDGNAENNSLNNLCVLCPNCHAQTGNYRGKNIARVVGTVDTAVLNTAAS